MKIDKAAHYDALAARRDMFRRRHGYYYAQLEKQYCFFIPDGKRVLEVGCSTGSLLNNLKPSYGVGVDISGRSIDEARRKFPHLTFVHGEVDALRERSEQAPFDYIVLSGLLGELDDVQDFFFKLRKFCTRDTRIVIEYHSLFWHYILELSERLGLKMPDGIQNWLTAQDIENFLTLAGFEAVKTSRSTLLPIYIPFVSDLINRFMARLPVFNALTLDHFIIARPVFGPRDAMSVTLLVTCRNE